jgi:hypothetical protein
LPPTVQSKLDATFMWTDKFISLLPTPILHIEVGKFDIQKIQNSNITNEEYQNGQCSGYYDTKYFVFARDNYICQVCKKRNKILRIHHIVYKSKGGTDRAGNLITICTDCHTPENHKQGGILYDWMMKHKKVKSYKEATFMNIVRRRTFLKYPDAITTYGSETSAYRKELGLEKTHYNDAITISKIKDIKENKNVPYKAGWYMNDMVICEGQIGWIYGFSGGKTSNACVLRDINGNIVRTSNVSKNTPSVNVSALKLICHNNNWQYQICNTLGNK